MPWLLRDGEVLATLEVAESFADRLKGLLGRPCFEGGLLLRPARSVHTLGMNFGIDVAFCSSEMVVIDKVSMAPWRVGVPRFHCSCIIEAETGAFERWNLMLGDQLELKG